MIPMGYLVVLCGKRIEAVCSRMDADSWARHRDQTPRCDVYHLTL
jgi:hypothetical protein